MLSFLVWIIRASLRRPKYTYKIISFYAIKSLNSNNKPAILKLEDELHIQYQVYQKE